jgi:hypothetical protein
MKPRTTHTKKRPQDSTHPKRKAGMFWLWIMMQLDAAGDPTRITSTTQNLLNEAPHGAINSRKLYFYL